MAPSLVAAVSLLRWSTEQERGGAHAGFATFTAAAFWSEGEMNRNRIGVLALAGVLVFSAAMTAAVTFDPSTGTGFVGKGDVQDAFGWNNAALQANAGAVTFTFESDAQYAQSCMKENARQTIYKDFKKTVEVDATVIVQARKNPQG